MAGRSARQIAPELVAGSIAELDDPETRRKLASVLTSPEVNAGVRQIARSMASGFVAGLPEGANREQLDDMVEGVSRAAVRGLLEELRVQVTPENRAAFEKAVRRVVVDAGRSTSHGFATGFAQAVESARVSGDVAPSETLFARTRALLARGTQLTIIVGITVVVLAIAIIAWLFRHRREERLHRHPAVQPMAPAGPSVAPVVLSPDLLAGLVQRALQEALHDAPTRQAILDQLRKTDESPGLH